MTPPTQPLPFTATPATKFGDQVEAQIDRQDVGLLSGLPGDPYADDAALLKTFKTFKQDCYQDRWVFERVWWRNLLYAGGRQWIYYDRAQNRWVDKRMAIWIPRPVTNFVAQVLGAIRAVFHGVQLAVRARPAGQDPQQLTTAETVDLVAQPLHEEHQMTRAMREGDFWFIMTGNVFYHVWWDKSGGGHFIQIPFFRCETCQETFSPKEIEETQGVCPQCGGQAISEARDAQGNPITEQAPGGRGRTDVVSPFEIAVPNGYTRFDDAPGCIRQRWRPRVWAEAHLPKELLGKIQWETLPGERSLQMMRALAAQSDIGGGPLSMDAGATTGQEGYTEYELWLKPSKAYPQGLFLRVVGEQIVLRDSNEGTPGPLPYWTPDGQAIFPFVHAGYEQVGGRIWAIGPIDLMIQKNDQINQLDSMTQLIIQRMSNPVWLEPKGAEVKKFTGAPGLVVRYNPLTVGGNSKPERIEGSNVPPSLLAIREQLIRDIKELTGTHDPVTGGAPTGVEAFSALQLLVERSQSRFTLPLSERGEAYRKWFQIALELERAYGPDDRFWAALGPNQGWTFQRFEKAKLIGNVEIIIEDGSTRPKTSLGERAALEQLNQMGLLDRSSPDAQYAILRTFGKTDLMPALDGHVKAAQQEQAAFERWALIAQVGAPAPQLDPLGNPLLDPISGAPMTTPTFQPPPTGFGRKPWHDDSIHWNEHRKWANTDRIRELLLLKPFLEPVVAQFIGEHEMVLQQQAAMEAQLSMAKATGTPPGQGGGGRAMANSNQESGNPRDVPRGTGQRPDNRGPE